MMYEMRSWKPEHTLLQTQGIFNLPHHIGMVWEELASDNTNLYMARKWIAAQLNVMGVTGIIYPCPNAMSPPSNEQKSENSEAYHEAGSGAGE